MTIYSLDVLLSHLEPVHCLRSSSNCCFLTSIHISQEAGKVVWHSHVFKNFPQFIVIHILSDFSTMTCLSWVAPRTWLSFIELDKTVVLVWLDWLVFCDYGFTVSALLCPLATPTVLLGFLLPWTWVSLHECSSKVQPLLLTLDEGYLLTATPPTLNVE